MNLEDWAAIQGILVGFLLGFWSACRYVEYRQRKQSKPKSGDIDEN